MAFNPWKMAGGRIQTNGEGAFLPSRSFLSQCSYKKFKSVIWPQSHFCRSERAEEEEVYIQKDSLRIINIHLNLGPVGKSTQSLQPERLQQDKCTSSSWKKWDSQTFDSPSSSFPTTHHWRWNTPSCQFNFYDSLSPSAEQGIMAIEYLNEQC